MRAFYTSFALALAMLVLLAGSTSAADVVRHCGAIRGEGVVPRDIVARNVRCTLARRVAGRAGKVTQAPWNGCVFVSGMRTRMKRGCVVRGFHCRGDGRGPYDELRVRCTRKRQRIRYVLS